MTLRKNPTVDWLYDTDFQVGIEAAVHQRLEVRGYIPDIFVVDVEKDGAVNDYNVMAEFPFEKYISGVRDAVQSWYEKQGKVVPLYAVGVYNLLRSHFDMDPAPFYAAGQRLKERGVLKLIDCFIFDAYLTGNPLVDTKILARLPKDVANAQSLLLKKQKGYAIQMPMYLNGDVMPVEAFAKNVIYCDQYFHGRILWHDFDSRGCILCKPSTDPAYNDDLVYWASQQWKVKGGDGSLTWEPWKWWGRISACEEVLRTGGSL